MAVKKVGKKFFPVGKKGKPWKTGFATEAKAKAALAKSNKYFKSLGSGKKKTTKARTSSKGKTGKKKKKSTKSSKKGSGKKMSKKRSWIGYARLAVYVLAASSAAIEQVMRFGATKEGALRIAHAYTGREPDGRFSGNRAIKTYGPLAAVAAVDGAASKLGVYKRMGAL